MNKVKLFKDSIKKYIDYFGLWEWEYHIKESEIPNYRARTSYYDIEENPEGSGYIVTFFYNVAWLKDKETNKEEIDKVAFHEVLELLFCKLRDWSENNNFHITKYQVDEEVHRIIRRLENKIWKLIK